MSEREEVAAGIFAARLRFWLLSGVLAGALLVVLALLVVTQTRWGHERVLSITLRAAAERLDGTLRVGRLEGNLLTGARLYDVALIGPDSVPFIVADSAFVEYSLRTIAADEIVLDRLVLFEPEILLRRMPGEAFWNFDRIFGDTLPADPGATREPRRPFVVRDAAVVGGELTVEIPWEPDPDLSPAERRAEIAEALSPGSNLVVREVAGGYLRRVLLQGVSAEVARLVSAPDELGGTSAHVAAFAGDVFYFRDPIPVRQLEGDVSYRDGLVRFQAPLLRLPQSRARLAGSLQFVEGEDLRIDVTVTADTVAFADLQWLYPPIPQEGGGSLELTIRTQPDGTLYLARRIDVAAPGTRLAGDFGLIVNDALRFVDVDLRADPLRVATVEELLPEGLPVVGLRIGAVEIRQAPS